MCHYSAADCGLARVSQKVVSQMDTQMNRLTDLKAYTVSLAFASHFIHPRPFRDDLCDVRDAGPRHPVTPLDRCATKHHTIPHARNHASSPTVSAAEYSCSVALRA